MAILRRVVSAVSGVFAFASWFGKETVKAWFFDHVIHVPAPTNAALIEYGVPAAFAALCIALLLWREPKGKRSETFADMATKVYPHLAPQPFWRRWFQSLAHPRPIFNAQSIYLTPYQALHYMANDSAWGRANGGAELDNANALLLAPEEFRLRASEGRVRVYGFSSASHQHEAIDKTHWMSFGLDPLAVYLENKDVNTTAITFQAGFYGVQGNTATYSELRIVAQDVYETWPV